MMNYRPDIDGLRAIAVISVVAYHSGFYGFSGGFIGVDVFFVLSGFLITNVLTKEIATSGTINLPRFYSNRFKRLYPALLFTLVITILCWMFLFLQYRDETRDFVKSNIYSVFGF